MAEAEDVGFSALPLVEVRWGLPVKASRGEEAGGE
jgi:hypothetical protein